jgi:hypothetical protein
MLQIPNYEIDALKRDTVAETADVLPWVSLSAGAEARRTAPFYRSYAAATQTSDTDPAIELSWGAAHGRCATPLHEESLRPGACGPYVRRVCSGRYVKGFFYYWHEELSYLNPAPPSDPHEICCRFNIIYLKSKKLTTMTTAVLPKDFLWGGLQ